MNNIFRYTIFLLLIIIGINISSNFIFNLASNAYDFSPALKFSMLGFSGVLSAIITTLIIITTAPVLKNYLITFRQLLRLDTLSHPLLLKLQELAPSTFQHSLHVANLAHRAAKAIKADAFLTRIGGYYHDVGKIKNPDFYVENNKNQNQVSTLSPVQIADKIHEHIKEGVRLAKEYNLPDEVVAFIPEHHGTLLAGNLYEKAKEEGIKVSKSEFRYPGPKPLSKETALVMISDAVESKIRSVSNLGEEEVINVVDSIIKERIEDNQFSMIGITKYEMQKIKKALIEGALIIHHQRIKYSKNSQ